MWKNKIKNEKMIDSEINIKRNNNNNVNKNINNNCNNCEIDFNNNIISAFKSNSRKINSDFVNKNYTRERQHKLSSSLLKLTSIIAFSALLSFSIGNCMSLNFRNENSNNNKSINNQEVYAATNSTSNDVNITVPFEIKFTLNSDGTNTYPDNFTITNDSIYKINLDSVSLTGNNNWKILGNNIDTKTLKKDSKKIKFYVNGTLIEPKNSYNEIINESANGLSILTLDEVNNRTINAYSNDTVNFSIERGAYSKNISTENAFTMNLNYNIQAISNTLKTGPEINSIIPDDTNRIEFITENPGDHKNLNFQLYDLSANQDMGIVGWTEESAKEDGTTEKVFKISSRRNGKKIVFNKECNRMFYLSRKNKTLKNIDFGNNIIDTSKIKNMSDMFSSNLKLTNLDVSEFDTSNVINMSCVFNSCRSITSLDLSSWNTSNVTYMYGLFSDCPALTSIKQNFDTINVENMSYMFCGTSLKEIDIENFETPKLTNIEHMFRSNYKLVKVNYKNLDKSKIENASYLFANCNKLVNILETNDKNKQFSNKLKDISYMFYNCENIDTNILIGDYSGVINMENCFTGMNNLQKIAFSSNFNFILGENNYIPTPSNNYINSADGYWYNIKTNERYLPSEIPSNHAATYVAKRNTITYENLGDAANSSNNPTYAANGLNKDLTIEPVTTNKTGYTFDGWSIKSKINNWHKGDLDVNTGEIIESTRGAYYSDKIPVKANITYSWNARTYNSENDRNEYLDGARYYKSNSSTAVLITDYSNSFTPSEDGYIRFLISKYTVELGNQFEFCTKTKQKSLTLQKESLTGNIILTANWAPNKYTNTISHILFGFKNNEGNLNTNKRAFVINTTTFNKNMDEKFKFTSDYYTKIPKGYGITSFSTSNINNDILGWNEEGWEEYDVSKEIKQKAFNMMFEMNYSPINYKITYNLNGGVNNRDNPSTYDVLYGISLNNPTKDGYVFDGWYDENNNKITGINEGCNATFSSVGDLYTKLELRTAKDITLTAKWTINKYNLNVNLNGGTWGNGQETQTLRQDYNSQLMLPTPTKEGYEFTGWKAVEGKNNKNVNIQKFGQSYFVRDDMKSIIEQNSNVAGHSGLDSFLYNNMNKNGNKTVTAEIINSDYNNKSNSNTILKMKTNGIAAPGAGGISPCNYWNYDSINYEVITAKIPKGYTLCYNKNTFYGGKAEWITSCYGTGEYETYILKITIGHESENNNYWGYSGKADNRFACGHLYLDGTDNTNVEWQISYFNVFDGTKVNDNSYCTGLYTYTNENQTIETTWKKKITITFDNQSMGTLADSNKTKTVLVGDKFGNLPEITDYKDNWGDKFDGWYTEPELGKGTKITKDTIVNLDSDTTLYAHSNVSWDLNSMVDGKYYKNLQDALCNLYIDGKKYSSIHLNDACGWAPYGTTYEIRNITYPDNYEYLGTYGDLPLSGKIGVDKMQYSGSATITNMILMFKTK